jgi:uncharacterized protein YndB with AHSA1/START domain
MSKLTFRKTATVNASIGEVWDALTDPAKIKQWLFGTDTHTDWRKGSPITYTGEYNGHQYKDGGIIIDIIPERKLHMTYFSSMSGKDDKAENYANVIYELQPAGDKTELTISQDNIDTEEQKRHMEQNWGMVMEGIKKVSEK